MTRILTPYWVVNFAHLRRRHGLRYAATWTLRRALHGLAARSRSGGR